MISSEARFWIGFGMMIATTLYGLLLLAGVGYYPFGVVLVLILSLGSLAAGGIR